MLHEFNYICKLKPWFPCKAKKFNTKWLGRALMLIASTMSLPVTPQQYRTLQKTWIHSTGVEKVKKAPCDLNWRGYTVSSFFCQTPGTDYFYLQKKKKITYGTFSKPAQENKPICNELVKSLQFALKLSYCDYKNCYAAYSVVKLYKQCSFSLIFRIDHSCHCTLVNRIFTLEKEKYLY